MSPRIRSEIVRLFALKARFIVAWGEAPGSDHVSVGVGCRPTSSAPDPDDDALLQSAYGGGAEVPGLRWRLPWASMRCTVGARDASGPTARRKCLRANGPAHMFSGQRPGAYVFGPTARRILAWGEAPGTDSVSVGVGHRSTSSAPNHGDEALLQSAYGDDADAPGLRCPRAALALTLGYYEVHPWRTGCIRAEGAAHTSLG